MKILYVMSAGECLKQKTQKLYSTTKCVAIPNVYSLGGNRGWHFWAGTSLSTTHQEGVSCVKFILPLRIMEHLEMSSPILNFLITHPGSSQLWFLPLEWSCSLHYFFWYLWKTQEGNGDSDGRAPIRTMKWVKFIPRSSLNLLSLTFAISRAPLSLQETNCCLREESWVWGAGGWPERVTGPGSLGILKDTFRESHATVVGKCKYCSDGGGWDHHTPCPFPCGQAEHPTQWWAGAERPSPCVSQGMQMEAHNFEVPLLQRHDVVNPVLCLLLVRATVPELSLQGDSWGI